MRPAIIQKALSAAVSVQQPVFLWGSPGIGKSSIVKDVAKQLGMKLIDLRLSLLDSVDLRGFPHMIDGVMHFATPSFLPRDPDSKGILFLDEMNNARPDTQSAAYQLVLDRSIGEYNLPDGWVVIAAGNRDHDGGHTHSMAAPLANRFVHFECEVNFDDWRAWAMATGITPEIVNFISFRPALLNDFENANDKKAFPTPRSWDFVNRILRSNADAEVERALIAGAVGDGATAEFLAFLKIYRNLPNPDAVLMNPSKAAVPTDLATLYALCGALAARASEANFGRLLEYCERLKEEFQMLTIRDAVMRKKELSHTQEFANWSIKNAHLLV